MLKASCKRTRNNHAGSWRRIRRRLSGFNSGGSSSGKYRLERGNPSDRMARRANCSRKIDDLRAGPLRRLPVSFCVLRAPRKKSEAGALETIFVKRSYKCGFTARLRQGSSKDWFIEKDDFSGREVAVFKNELELFPAQRGSAHNRDATRFCCAASHALSGPRSRAVSNEPYKLHDRPMRSVGGCERE